MTERDILKQEELDFGRVFNRIFRAWPVTLISSAIRSIMGLLFISISPSSYTARTSFLVRETFLVLMTLAR